MRQGILFRMTIARSPSAVYRCLASSRRFRRQERPLMYRDKYFREWFGPVPFNFAEAMRLGPQLKQPGLYHILYKRKPVYIGVSSVSIFDRLKRHVTGAGNQ